LYESKDSYSICAVCAERRVKELTYNSKIHTGHESYHPAVVVPDDEAAIQEQ
jgi:Cys-tRNA synthase (O-phospho-L-seryl-tRNA:Cys-tRNA synthase)